MDGPRAPPLGNLLIGAKNLISCLQDSFDITHSIDAAPPWVHSLWAEIVSLHSLLDCAVKLGLDISCFDGEAEEATRVMKAADDAMRELEQRVSQLQDEDLGPASIMSIDESTCLHYYRLLERCRLRMADSLNRLQV
jgi:hypothetical protein